MHSKSTSKLLDAAAVILAQDPSATLGEISERAGVGRATLHRHFATRRDLIRALTLDALQRIEVATAEIGTVSEDPQGALRRLTEAIVPLGDRFRFLSSGPLDHDDAEVRVIYDRQTSALTALAEAMKAEALIAPDIPTAWATATIDALIYAAWQAVEDGEIARRDAPAHVFRTLTRGLG